MRAILTVPPAPADFHRGPRWLPLAPVADRPFLQHVVEHLVASGVNDIHLVVGRGAAEVEQLLGDGERWGCQISYYVNRDLGRAVRAVAAAGETGELLLIGRADQLPQLPDRLEDGRTVFDAPDGWWTGWAVVDPADLTGSVWQSWPDLELELAEAGVPGTEVPVALRMRTAADLLPAQSTALKREFPGLMMAARELQPGVWVARNSSIHPTAELIAPLFIGKGSSVGPRATVGPNVAIGAGCLLDADAGVRDSLLLTGSYVGPGVQLDGVVVDGNHLTHPERPGAVRVEQHLLDALPDSAAIGAAASSLVVRAVAAVVFVAALPLLALTALWLRATRPGPVFWRRSFVQTPVAVSEADWKERSVRTLAPPAEAFGAAEWVIPATVRGVLLEFVPALIAVARGHLRLVGLPPRPAEVLRQIGPDRQAALLGAGAGLVTEAALDAVQYVTPETLLSDVIQAHTSDFRSNARRLGRFLLAVLNPMPRPPRRFASLAEFSLAAP